MDADTPSDWTPTRMGRVSSLKGRLGWQGLKAAHYRSLGPYVVSSAHFDNQRVRWELCPRVSVQRYEADSNIQLRVDDVLLMKDGAALGKLAFVDALPGPACLNSHLLLFRPIQDSYWPKFLFYILDSTQFQAYIHLHATGVTFLGISQKAVGEYPLRLPNLVEQRQIAGILDTIDVAIRKTEQIIAKLKQVKQGLLHDLLTRGIDENGELRDPERNPEQFKDSPFGRIPEKWGISALHDIASAPICYGIVQAGPFVPDGTPVLTIGDLRGDFRTDLHLTARHIDEQYVRSRVIGGDLLLSIKGTIGRSAVAPSHYSGNISRDLARIRLRAAEAAGFLDHYLQSPAGQRRLELCVVGTTRAEISIHTLKRFLVPLPPPDEQNEVSCRLTNAAAALRTEEARHRKLLTLKRGLMTDLLTGRVRTTALDGATA